MDLIVSTLPPVRYIVQHDVIFHLVCGILTGEQGTPHHLRQQHLRIHVTIKKKTETSVRHHTVIL